jgi:hypothetical protein
MIAFTLAAATLWLLTLTTKATADPPTGPDPALTSTTIYDVDGSYDAQVCDKGMFRTRITGQLVVHSTYKSTDIDNASSSFLLEITNVATYEQINDDGDLVPGGVTGRGIVKWSARAELVWSNNVRQENYRVKSIAPIHFSDGTNQRYTFFTTIRYDWSSWPPVIVDIHVWGTPEGVCK